MSIRQAVKKISLAYAANSRLKGWILDRMAVRVEARYKKLVEERGIEYHEGVALALLKNRMARHGVEPNRIPIGQLNIVWVGANKQQDYSGFLQALRKLGKVREFTRVGGEYGLANPWPDDFEVREENSRRLRDVIDEEIHSNNRIDLLIGQMWSKWVSVDVLKYARSRGALTVNIAMDDRLPNHWLKTTSGQKRGAIGLIDGVDLTLTTCPECCVRYLVHGAAARFFPLASDPELFKPSKNKDLDVVFIGNKYGNRGRLVESTLKRRIAIHAYGHGWPNGYASAKQSAELFGRAKIILGSGLIGYSNKYKTLKLRDFDATMSGALYITHCNPDLLRLFHLGKEIECYNSEEEAIAKIEKYLNGEPKRVEMIGHAARAKAEAYHSWERRLTDVLQFVGYR